MVLSKPFDLLKNHEHIIRIALETENLGNDMYCLDIGILKKDNTGNFLMYDTPSANMYLRLVNEAAHDLIWHKDYWGNVKFEDLDVSDCSLK